MNNKILNMKRRRGPSEQIFQESSEFNYYPYSNIKNLKQDLTDNTQESFKKKKLDENSNQNNNTFSFNDSSYPVSTGSFKLFPYAINEVIKQKYKVSNNYITLFYFDYLDHKAYFKWNFRQCFPM